MLGFTCNNVVQQQHLVVQQHLLPATTIINYYHRENFARARHKKAHRFTGGLRSTYKL